jgi:hypothetical protein
MMMKKVVRLSLAVLVASACSRGSAPTSSDSVAGPSLAGGSGVQSSARSAALVPANCTLTQGFWKNHARAWPVDTLVLGGVTYTQAEAIAILRTAPRGDATYILIDQLIAATLSLAHGADASAIAATVAAADAWLSAHPLGSRPTGSTRDEGIGLAAALDDFNNGRTGPGHCGDEGTPVPSPTPTLPSATPTDTATPTATATPTDTPPPA